MSKELEEAAELRNAASLHWLMRWIELAHHPDVQPQETKLDGNFRQLKENYEVLQPKP